MMAFFFNNVSSLLSAWISDLTLGESCFCLQFFTQSLGGSDSRNLQIKGSVGPASLGSGFLRSLVWTLSALCPRVWGSGPGERPLSFWSAVQKRLLTAFQSWRSFDRQMLKGEVRAGKVDCQAHYQTCQSAGITAYPTVKFYPYLGSQKVRTHTQVQKHTCRWKQTNDDACFWVGES